MRGFWRKRLLALIGVTLALGAAAAALPDNPYQRWQLLDGTIHANARWIYERIHFDPTPIDVAFVGPSRLAQGVDAPRLGRALAARGLPSNVVNFGLPEGGRNIHAAIVDELLAERRPSLIVIGVIEKPSRFGHSAYKFIAPAGDLIDPGHLGNVDYPSNMIYLPFRQLKLFAARVLPDMVGLAPGFEPGRYRGPSIDTTGDVILPDGTVKNGTRPADAAELERGVRKLERTTRPPILPRELADLEFGDERHFIRHIGDLARARDVPVAFLFMPYFTGPDALQERDLYERYGPVFDAHRIAERAELFSDYGHLTAAGADTVTDMLVEPVAALLRKAK